MATAVVLTSMMILSSFVMLAPNVWANNEVTVPKFVLTYYDTVYAFEGPEVYARDCVENFSYTEIMKPTYVPRPPRDDEEDDE